MNKKAYSTASLSSEVIKITLQYLTENGQSSFTLLYQNLERQLPSSFWWQLSQKGGVSEYHRIINYLKQRGYINKSGRGGESLASITHSGALRLQRINLNHMSLDKNGKWDEKWRIVTYDIPESHKVARNALRRLLKQLGFRQLYQSVWIHPLPCTHQINTIKDRYNINERIMILEVATFDEEPRFKWLFREFIQ